MKKNIPWIFTFLFFSFVIFSSSCRKDTLSKYDTALDNMKIFEDDSIALPVAVAAGDNCLLSAYNTSAGRLKFNLSDNNGKLIWEKQFGINSIAKILKENDGTFSIFPGNHRIINISKDGTVLRDDPQFMDSLYGDAVLFNVLLDKGNNYIVTGIYGTGLYGVNRPFASGYRHDGTFMFQKGLVDTAPGPNTVVSGNYSAISGCEFTDDGNYLFFGNTYYVWPYRNILVYTFFKINPTGQLLWKKEYVLRDSLQIPDPRGGPPFSNQLPLNTSVFGFHPESFTHEIMRTADGNFLCFLNVPDYMASDQSARVYKIDQDGNVLDSAFINFGRYNRLMGSRSLYYRYTNVDKSYTCGDAVVKNADNTFSICMQNGFFGAKGLTNSYLGESRSFVVRIDQDLNILDTRFLQSYYTDCFTSVCKSSDGRTVYFGLISSFGNSYKPVFVFSKDQ